MSKTRTIIIFVLVSVSVLLGCLYLVSQQKQNEIITEDWLKIETPTVFAANQTASIKIDLGKEALDTVAILEDSAIDIIGPQNNSEKDNFEVDLVSGENGEGDYELKVSPKKQTLKPGRYKVSARFVTEQGIKDYSQDFYWGVLALNTNKSVYLPGETAYLQMGVVDDKGDTVCNAKMILQITDPKGEIQELTTENGGVISNPKCGPNNVINTPDYYAHYQLAESGIYQIRLTAQMTDGSHRSLYDFIEVKENLPFEIERIGPTRIYPPSSYLMRIKVKANQDFQGKIIEKAPASFRIWQDQEILMQEQVLSFNAKSPSQEPTPGAQTIVWQDIALQKGEETELQYTFKAPNISPYFYLLGALEIIDASGFNFQEARRWQIAADVPTSPTYPGTITVIGTLAPWDDCAWVNGDNAKLDDDVYADVGTGNTCLDSGSYTHQLQATNFGFSIDGAAAIVGIEVGFGRYSSDNTLPIDDLVRLVWNGAMEGTNQSLGAAWPIADATSTFGGATNLMGFTTTTPAIVNDNTFGVTVAALGVSNNSQVDIDFLRMIIYYSIGTAPTIISSSDFPDPQSAGGAVDFKVNWSDDDSGDLVKIHICKTADITNQTCDNGSWCDTDYFTTHNPLICHYQTTVADIGAKDYFPYVCDDSNDCSAAPGASTFTVVALTEGVKIKGGTVIKGGTKIRSE